MIKGGYKIIDFNDAPFTTGGETITIDGIYDSVKLSCRKPLLFSGINIDGIKRNCVYVIPLISGSNYVFTAYGKTITITNADAVSVTSA